MLCNTLFTHNTVEDVRNDIEACIERNAYMWSLTRIDWNQTMSVATQMASTISVRLDDDLAENLEEYRATHKFPPDKSEVVRTALREFLERELSDTSN